jgi:hypothetical protein
MQKKREGGEGRYLERSKGEECSEGCVLVLVSREDECTLAPALIEHTIARLICLILV